MNKSIIFICSLALLIAACKKEKTSWETDWSAPLVHGTLTLNDLVPADYTQTNGDNYISIVYNERAFGVSLDTLLDLPDTNIIAKTAFGFPLTVNPGFIWVDSADQDWNLGDIEIKQLMAKEGLLTFICRSEWGGKTIMSMDFPKVSYQGVPYYKSYYLDAGTVANPTVEIDEIDMAGYWLDLTGLSGDLYNTLSGNFIVESNDPNTFNVSTYDSLEYEIHFENVVIDYAKGYFGNHVFSDTTAIALPFMNSVLGGIIDIDSIDMNIEIRNGFNLIAQAKLTLLRGINSKQASTVDLGFPQLGNTLNLNPATGDWWGWNYSNYPITINNNNSNITTFLENLSDSLLIGYEVEINPFGNVTGGSDEVFPGSTIDIYVDGEFPLDFGAQDLALTDTFDFSFNASESYSGNSGQIFIDYTNGFPMSASSNIYLLNENDVVIDSIIGDSPILSGIYNSSSYATTPTSGTVTYNLNSSNFTNLHTSTKLAIIAVLNTDNGQKVKVDANAALNFVVRSNLNIQLNL